MLAGVVGVTAVEATPAAAADPDGALLTLGRELMRREADFAAFMRQAGERWGADLPDHVMETETELCGAIMHLRDEIAELPGRTAAGRAIKAEVMWVLGGALHPPEPGSAERLEWSLLRDVIEAGGGAMPAGLTAGGS